MLAPLFILCPGRSFSSVVASMIGQHPDAYGLPELNLFLGPTLGASNELYSATGRMESVGLKYFCTDEENLLQSLRQSPEFYAQAKGHEPP